MFRHLRIPAGWLFLMGMAISGSASLHCMSAVQADAGGGHHGMAMAGSGDAAPHHDAGMSHHEDGASRDAGSDEESECSMMAVCGIVPALAGPAPVTEGLADWVSPPAVTLGTPHLPALAFEPPPPRALS